MASSRGAGKRVLRFGAQLLVPNPYFVMVAVETSSTIQRGTDWDFSFRIRENGLCGDLTDLTDWTVAVTLKTSAGVALTTPSIVRPDAETVSLRLNQTQTAALALQFGAQLVVTVTRPDGWDIRLIQGRISIV